MPTYDEALRKIEDFDYDCIILDINLPDGTGLGLLRQLRIAKKDDGVVRDIQATCQGDIVVMRGNEELKPGTKTSVKLAR